MYETSKFNPNIGENNMPKYNNNLVNQIMEDKIRETSLKSEHKSLYEEMYWNDKMWEEEYEYIWDKKFHDEYFNDTKNDLKNIKQTLFQMQTLITLIENDINNMEDRNNAVS